MVNVNLNTFQQLTWVRQAGRCFLLSPAFDMFSPKLDDWIQVCWFGFFHFVLLRGKSQKDVILVGHLHQF